MADCGLPCGCVLCVPISDCGFGVSKPALAADADALRAMVAKVSGRADAIAPLDPFGPGRHAADAMRATATGSAAAAMYLDESSRGMATSGLARLITEAQHAACVHARAAAEELERELRDDPYAAAVVSQAAASAHRRAARRRVGRARSASELAEVTPSALSRAGPAAARRRAPRPAP